MEEILKLQSQEEIILKVGERIWGKIKDFNSFDHLSEPEKAYMYIDNLEREVFNGGFDQFFFNTSGEYAHEALQAYVDIGAERQAEIVYKAINSFPELPIPKALETRRSCMENVPQHIEKTWNELDTEFYKDDDIFFSLLIQYITLHKEKF